MPLPLRRPHSRRGLEPGNHYHTWCRPHSSIPLTDCVSHPESRHASPTRLVRLFQQPSYCLGQAQPLSRRLTGWSRTRHPLCTPPVGPFSVEGGETCLRRGGPHTHLAHRTAILPGPAEPQPQPQREPYTFGMRLRRLRTLWSALSSTVTSWSLKPSLELETLLALSKADPPRCLSSPGLSPHASTKNLQAQTLNCAQRFSGEWRLPTPRPPPAPQDFRGEGGGDDVSIF